MVRRVKFDTLPEIMNEIADGDLINAEYDLQSVDTTELLVILSTERSGSTFLCEQLSAIDYCYAHEYFQHYQYLQILARRWNFMDGKRINWKRFGQALRTHRTAPNGVLGINVHGYQLDWFQQVDFTDLPVRYIHVVRNDIIGQALSYDRAIQTGQWSSLYSKNGDYHYSFDSTLNAMHYLQRQSARVCAFINANNLNVDVLTFEDIISDPISAIRTVTGLTDFEEKLSKSRLSMINQQKQSQYREIFSQSYLKHSITKSYIERDYR